MIRTSVAIDPANWMRTPYWSDQKYPRHVQCSVCRPANRFAVALAGSSDALVQCSCRTPPGPRWCRATSPTAATVGMSVSQPASVSTPLFTGIRDPASQSLLGRMPIATTTRSAGSSRPLSRHTVRTRRRPGSVLVSSPATPCPQISSTP